MVKPKRTKKPKPKKPYDMTNAELLAEAFMLHKEIAFWNNMDIKGHDDISPNMDQLKARRGCLNRLGHVLYFLVERT